MNLVSSVQFGSDDIKAAMIAHIQKTFPGVNVIAEVEQVQIADSTQTAFAISVNVTQQSAEKKPRKTGGGRPRKNKETVIDQPVEAVVEQPADVAQTNPELYAAIMADAPVEAPYEPVEEPAEVVAPIPTSGLFDPA